MVWESLVQLICLGHARDDYRRANRKCIRLGKEYYWLKEKQLHRQLNLEWCDTARAEGVKKAGRGLIAKGLGHHWLSVYFVISFITRRRVSRGFEARGAMLICAVLKDHFGNRENGLKRSKTGDGETNENSA